MSNVTLLEWSAIAQLALTAITFVGIVASIFFSIRALREIQQDRRERQRPHLAFESRGQQISVEFVKAGTAVPGMNPIFAKRMFSDLPQNAESVRIKCRKRDNGSREPNFYGRLRNYGLGSGLETWVTWIPESVKIGSESFRLDSQKLKEARYTRKFNSMPSWQSHIPAGEETQLTRLPTFIEKDHEKKITEVRGRLEIECRDVFRVKHTTVQEFYLATHYSEEEPYVHITFSAFHGDKVGEDT